MSNYQASTTQAWILGSITIIQKHDQVKVVYGADTSFPTKTMLFAASIWSLGLISIRNRLSQPRERLSKAISIFAPLNHSLHRIECRTPLAYKLLQVAALYGLASSGESRPSLRQGEWELMERRQMGKHGLEVSTLCLGTMTFGFQIDRSSSFEILDKAFDHRLSFLDTSDVYPTGAGLKKVGVTEQIIGEWMKERGNRDAVLLATKCCGPTRHGLNNWGLSRQHIMEAVENSLRRLGTDYIDLYQAHQPDQRVPIEESLRAFDDLVTQGKVRYIGCANYATWQLSDAVKTAENLNFNGYISVQPRYNLLYRDIEVELIPFCQNEGLGVIVYNPLAGGFLSGKYSLDSGLEENTRFTLGTSSERYQERYWQEEQFKAVATLKEVVDARNQSLVSVAIAWVVRQPGITSALIGASSAGQLDASLAYTDVEFDEELISACEAVWWSLPRRPVASGYM